MSRNEAKVRAVYPRAYADRFKTNGGGSYWLVWGAPYHQNRLASGDTKAQAWAAAARYVATRPATVSEEP